MTKALTTSTGAQAALDTVETDPRLLMAAKAIQLMAGTNEDGTPKITADMALAAAMYQAGTGQLLGRDFYVNERIGRMEGYRGVSRDAVDRGIGEVQIKYRSLTAEEADDHEIQAGDTAVVCEVYQLRAWRLAQQMGQRYEPVSGVGVVRKIEKHTAHKWEKSSSGKSYKAVLPEAQWKPLQLEGGMTWRKKAQNRAYKEALRHVPGGHASADEILEEAALRGMAEMPPEAARLTMEQAQAWVEQHGDDTIEGEYTETQHVASNVHDGYQPAPGEDVWADWRNPGDAQAWAMTQGKFNGQRHMENAYAKVKGDCNPKTAREMWACWYSYVMAHEPAKAAADTTGWADVDAHGHDADDEPQFS